MLCTSILKPSHHLPATVGDILLVVREEKEFIQNNKALHSSVIYDNNPSRLSELDLRVLCVGATAPESVLF